jgi:hypothetical protein
MRLLYLLFLVSFIFFQIPNAKSNMIPRIGFDASLESTPISKLSDCVITDFIVFAFGPDSCDGELIVFEFEFIAENFGLNGFTLMTEGGWSETYQIGDDYLYWGFPYCDENVVFTITDSDDSNCTFSYDFGPACCPCETIFDLQVGECVNNSFNIDFRVLWGPAGSCGYHGFRLDINGEPFELTEIVPITHNRAVNVESSDSILILDYCTNAIIDDCFQFEIANVCYYQCSFDAGFGYEFCDRDTIRNFEFTVINYENTGNEFIIKIDGIDQGTFEFQVEGMALIYVVESFYSPNELLLVEICSSTDPGCCIASLVSNCPPIQPCSITQFNVEALEDSCNDNSLQLLFNFDSEEFGINGFVIEGNGQEWGFSLGDDYIFSVPADCNTNYQFMIRDSDDESCFAEFSFGQACCPCHFDFSVELDSCMNDSLNLRIYIDAEGSCALNEFTVNINGDNYLLTEENGHYKIDGLAITDSLLSIELCTHSPADSCLTTVLSNPCYLEDDGGGDDDVLCFFNMSANFTDCVEDTIHNLHLLINDYSLTGDMFQVQIDSDSLGILSFQMMDDELFFIIPEYFSDADSLNITICHPDSILCCNTVLIENCRSNEEDTCRIENFNVTALPADCEDDVLLVSFEFDGVNFGQNGFTIFDGSNSQSYQLLDDFIFVLDRDCDTHYTISIWDNENTECRSAFDFGQACCDCTLDFNVSQSECEEGLHNATFTIDSQGDCTWNELTVRINGIPYDYTESDSQYIIANIAEQDSILFFEFCVNFSVDTCFLFVLSNPCFDSQNGNECVFIELNIAQISTECEEDKKLLRFGYEVNNPGGNGYTVLRNGMELFTSEYHEILEFWVDSDCENPTTFSIVDNEYGACFLEDTLLVCCEAEEECQLEGIDTSTEYDMDCNSITLNASFLFLGDCDLSHFTISQNGLDPVRYDYEQSIRIEFPIEQSMEEVELIICFPEIDNICFTILIDPCETSSTTYHELEDIEWLYQTNRIFIRNPQLIKAQIRLVDVLGRQLLKEALIEEQKELEVNYLPTGIYILLIESLSGIRSEKIFISN